MTVARVSPQLLSLAAPDLLRNLPDKAKAWADLVLALGADPIRVPLAGDAADAVGGFASERRVSGDAYRLNLGAPRALHRRKFFLALKRVQHALHPWVVI